MFKKDYTMDFLLETFQIVENCINNYKLNISIKEDQETCVFVLWFYIMFKKLCFIYIQQKSRLLFRIFFFLKNSFCHPHLTYFLAERSP